MNNRIIFSSIIIVLTFGIVGSYFLQSHKSTTANLQDVIFSPLVKGCAENDKNELTRYQNEEKEQEPKIDVNGNEIFYSRAIKHLCCRKAEIEKEIENSVINIYEIWTGIGCKCICFSEIGAKIQNIPRGIYTINVYEKGTRPESEELMEEKLIISQKVVIK